MRLRAIVVDDEPLARRGIVARLERAGDIDIVAECSNGREAIDAIRAHPADVVFLDVQMPGIDGFDVIDGVGVTAMPEVIFVTAYDSHALAAFEAEALDYLLKPIDDERFARALARVRARVRERAGAPGSNTDKRPARLVIKDRGRVVLLEARDVDYIRAEGDYVRVYTRGRSYLVRETLGAMELRLDAQDFARIHRSAIVRVDRIRELVPMTNREFGVVLHDGTQLKVSRSYRDSVEALKG